jgi:hypothetical protein
MKILYVVGDPTMRLSDNTGYARHMRECISALKSLGSEVQVLTSGDEKSTVAQKKAFGKAKQLMPAWASNIVKDVARITYDARFAGRIEAAVPAVSSRHNLRPPCSFPLFWREDRQQTRCANDSRGQCYYSSRG